MIETVETTAATSNAGDGQMARRWCTVWTVAACTQFRPVNSNLHLPG
jgi:hypothetical protein